MADAVPDSYTPSTSAIGAGDVATGGIAFDYAPSFADLDPDDMVHPAFSASPYACEDMSLESSWNARMESRLKNVEDMSGQLKNDVKEVKEGVDEVKKDLKDGLEELKKTLKDMDTKFTNAYYYHAEILNSVRADTYNIQAAKHNARCVISGKQFRTFRKRNSERADPYPPNLQLSMPGSIFLTSSSRSTSRNSTTGIEIAFARYAW